jgi:diguanylate cyclase (GGDEF)-like protein
LIAPVWTNPLTGVQGVPVTRRLATGAAFEGLITATVNPTALSVDYARTEARGTAVGVLGVDGIFRSRTVDGKHSFGDRADPARLVERTAEVRTTGTPLKSPIDGRSRFLSAVKVDKYPLYAVVAVDAENALATYRHTRDKILTWAAVVALGVVLVGWVVWLQVRRLGASRRRTQKAEAAFRATLEGSLDAVAILAAERDAAGVLLDFIVTDCNTLAASLIGRERQQLLGRRLCELTPTMSPFLKYFEQVIHSRQASQAQLLAMEPHLLGRWLHYQLVPLEDGIALITRDVTDKKSAEEALAALARCDALTKLSNRRHFEEVLDAARARAIRCGETMALMYIDLDGFKAINDTLGHAAGDAVLVEVARRLKAAVRETDTVGRLGGDEFVVLTERAGSLQDVRDLSERVVDALRESHELSGHRAFATPSVGVAVFDSIEPASTLCERADTAMYLAKSTGKSKYVMAQSVPGAVAKLTVVR